MASSAKGGVAPRTPLQAVWRIRRPSRRRSFILSRPLTVCQGTLHGARAQSSLLKGGLRQHLPERSLTLRCAPFSSTVPLSEDSALDSQRGAGGEWLSAAASNGLVCLSRSAQKKGGVIHGCSVLLFSLPVGLFSGPRCSLVLGASPRS